MNRFFEFSRPQIRMLAVLAVLLVLLGGWLFVRDTYLRPATPVHAWQVETIPDYQPPLVIDLNRAAPDSLELVPGIGPVLARRIDAWRREHGPFAAVESLAAVPGIGPQRVRQLRPYLTVSAP